ncbi:MAG: HAD hydrolase family protein [bacterium]|nr:MAG: HAD hydrolase family protein [bacterium]
MKPISELTEDDVKNIKVVCFDVDGVTIKKGTEISEKGTELKVKTSPLEDKILQKIIKLKKYFHITVNSGRSTMYLTKVFQEMLWGNASVIGEIGIFTVKDGELKQTDIFTDYELETLRKITVDLQKLANENDKARGFEPKQFLITLHCFEAIPAVDEVVKKHDIKNEFYCWWNGEAYDIAPYRFNKGVGLKKLCEQLGIDISQTIAVGNGINDKDMTDVAGIGVTTDKEHLESDYFIDGEHLGGEYLMDKLLELKGDK